jgi:hypothetical protein
MASHPLWEGHSADGSLPARSCSLAPLSIEQPYSDIALREVTLARYRKKAGDIGATRFITMARASFG